MTADPADGVVGAFGDAADLGEIFREHVPLLRALIGTRVPDHLVDDTVQDTFVRLHSSRARFDPRPPVFPYLARLAYRASHETLRRERLRQRVASQALPELRTGDPQDEVEAAERARAVRRVLAELPPRQRRLLYERLVLGVPYGALADIEAIAPDAVRAAVYRARRAFVARWRDLVGPGGPAAVATAGLSRARERLRRVVTWASSPWRELPTVAVAGAAAVVAAVSTLALYAAPSGSRVDAGRGGFSSQASAAPAAGPERPGATEGGTEEVVGSGRAASPTVVEPTPRPPVEVRPATGIALGPEGAEATFTLRVEDPSGGGRHDTEVPVHCNHGTVSTALCVALRATPFAE